MGCSTSMRILRMDSISFINKVEDKVKAKIEKIITTKGTKDFDMNTLVHLSF